LIYETRIKKLHIVVVIAAVVGIVYFDIRETDIQEHVLMKNVKKLQKHHRHMPHVSCLMSHVFIFIQHNTKYHRHIFLRIFLQHPIEDSIIFPYSMSHTKKYRV